jgi:hypothetical protein
VGAFERRWIGNSDYQPGHWRGPLIEHRPNKSQYPGELPMVQLSPQWQPGSFGNPDSPASEPPPLELPALG